MPNRHGNSTFDLFVPCNTDKLLVLPLNDFNILQCDFYNWGHLEKVNQLDDRKITIQSEKITCQ